jgi:type I restriction enzyme S subunit
MGWRVGTLGEEFVITMGQSPPGESYNEDGTGVLFFQGRTDFTQRFPLPRLHTTQPKRFAMKYDCLLSVRAPVGDMNMAFEDCCIGRGLAAIHSDTVPFYLYEKMCLLKPEFEKFESEGTVFGSINKEGLAAIQISMPPDAVKENFEGKVQYLSLQAYNNQRQIQTLTRLRDTLLPRLMSGCLRVPVAGGVGNLRDPI